MKRKRRTKADTSALSALYQSNPELFREFLQGLAQSVGLQPSVQEVASFECPSCGSKLTISNAAHGRAALGNGRRGKRQTLKGTVNPLLVRLAKVKGVMVGDVHKEFSKALGSRKSLSKDDIRAKKLAWIKSELKRLQGRKKQAA